MNSRLRGSRGPLPPSHHRRNFVCADAAACSPPHGRTVPSDGIHETVGPSEVPVRKLLGR